MTHASGSRTGTSTDTSTDTGAGHDPRLTDPSWRDGLADDTVAAVGAMTEALETVEVARGHLFAFHQLTGSADIKLERAITMLAEAGHGALAERLTRELLGRNVLPGRWTFQVIEDYADTYYEPFRDLEREVRRLTRGLPHLHEADLKRRRRSAGEPGHEATPRDTATR